MLITKGTKEQNEAIEAARTRNLRNYVRENFGDRDFVKEGIPSGFLESVSKAYYAIALEEIGELQFAQEKEHQAKLKTAIERLIKVENVFIDDDPQDVKQVHQDARQGDRNYILATLEEVRAAYREQQEAERQVKEMKRQMENQLRDSGAMDILNGFVNKNHRNLMWLIVNQKSESAPIKKEKTDDLLPVRIDIQWGDRSLDIYSFTNSCIRFCEARVSILKPDKGTGTQLGHWAEKITPPDINSAEYAQFLEMEHRRFSNIKFEFDRLFDYVEMKGLNVPKHEIDTIIRQLVIRSIIEKLDAKLDVSENATTGGYASLFHEIFGENSPDYHYIFRKWLAHHGIHISNGEAKQKLDRKQRQIEVGRWGQSLTSRVVLDELAKISSMSGVDFENFLTTIFSNQGYKVELTKATGDQGADLVINKYGVRTVVQAKRYSGAVGNAAVQAIVAAKGYYGAEKAMIVTNSNFTPSAKALAQANNVELIDKEKLQNWIASV